MVISCSLRSGAGSILQCRVAGLRKRPLLHALLLGSHEADTDRLQDGQLRLSRARDALHVAVAHHMRALERGGRSSDRDAARLHRAETLHAQNDAIAAAHLAPDDGQLSGSIVVGRLLLHDGARLSPVRHFGGGNGRIDGDDGRLRGGRLLLLGGHIVHEAESAVRARLESLGERVVRAVGEAGVVRRAEGCFTHRFAPTHGSR